MTILKRFKTLAAGAVLAVGAMGGAWHAQPVLADDIDIYRNFTPNPLKPPLVVILLDLNTDTTAIECNNVFTDAACQSVRDDLDFQTLIEDLLGANFTAVRNTVLTLTLGLVDIAPLAATNAQTAITTVGATVLSVATGALSAVDGAEALTLTLTNLVREFTDFRVAVMVSHSNLGTETTVDGKTYACAFSDLEAIPGARADTTACSNGGYFLVGFTDLLNDPLGIAETQLITKLTTLVANAVFEQDTPPLEVGDPAHPYQGKELYMELYQYLTGGAIYNGHLGYYDYGSLNPATNLDTSQPLLVWDSGVENGSNYHSAIDDFGECDIINAVNLMFTDSTGDDDSDAALLSVFPGADLNNDGDLSFAELTTYAEVSGFTHNGNPFKIRSSFAVNGATGDSFALNNLGQTVEEAPALVNLLKLGESVRELQENALEVEASLQTATVTADASAATGVLPTALFTLFKPVDGSPRWSGNLKKLKIELNNGNFIFTDANNNEAIADDGRIEGSALTFWTDGTQLLGLGADGRTTTLGGAGQKLPGYLSGNPGTTNGSGVTSATGPRKLFYDRATPVQLGALNATSTSVQSALRTDLGVATNAAASQLLHYARGYEVGTTAAPAASYTAAARSWWHGAVLHSRPIAINYGARSGYSSSNPDIRIVYGSADGYLRMLTNTETSGAESGRESWAFMPRSVMNQQKVLMDEDNGGAFPYGVDGPVVAYVQDFGSSGGVADNVINSGNPDDAAWLFFGLRRSGAFYYGINATDPDNPSLMWRIGSTDVSYTEMGLSFSEPVVARIAYKVNPADTTATTKTVLFVAGGYASKKDGENGSGGNLGTDDGQGNAIYLIDAETGALIWKAKQGTFSVLDNYNDATQTYPHPLLQDSIPSQISVLDTDGDGFADRFYVGDTGGRVWRGDLPGADRNSWTLTPIFSVGRHDDATLAVTHDRRFFHRPDFVPTRSETGSYDAILIASGDREDPTNLTTENYLYAFRDTDVSTGKDPADIILTEAQLVAASATHDDFEDITAQCIGGAACPDDTALATGWKLKLAASGEKGLSTPLTLDGVAFLTTFVPPDPSTTTCIPAEGFSQIYAVALNNGRPTDFTDFTNDSDGNDRTRRAAASGLPGVSTPVTTNNIAVGSEVLKVPARQYWRTFWRERLGEPEQPITP